MGQLFVSYRREDEAFVLPLAQGLKDRHIDVWLDQWSIPLGDDWDIAIEEALLECPSFLIVVSPESVKAREVRAELRTALDDHKLIITVLYKKCRVPRHLRLIQFIDFSSRPPDDPEGLDEIAAMLSAEGAELPAARKRQPRFVSFEGLTDDEYAGLRHVLDRYEVFMAWLNDQAQTPEAQQVVSRRVEAYQAMFTTSRVFDITAYRDLVADLEHLVYVIEELFEGELAEYVTGTDELMEAVGQAVTVLASREEFHY